MKTAFHLACLALVVAFAHAVSAQNIQGKSAPSFSMGGVVNPYGPTDLSQMKGDVVVIKVWGIT